MLVHIVHSTGERPVEKSNGQCMCNGVSQQIRPQFDEGKVGISGSYPQKVVGTIKVEKKESSL